MCMLALCCVVAPISDLILHVRRGVRVRVCAAKFVEFDIPYELIGLAIGKKGANIQKATKLKGVIAVNVSKEGHVTIRAEV